jgi:hypothetical protein
VVLCCEGGKADHVASCNNQNTICPGFDVPYMYVYNTLYFVKYVYTEI